MFQFVFLQQIVVVAVVLVAAVVFAVADAAAVASWRCPVAVAVAFAPSLSCPCNAGCI